MKLNANDIKEFIIKHYQYFGVGVLFICLVVVLLIFSAGRKKEEAAQTVDTVSESTSSEDAIEVPETPLETDAHEDVNNLVNQYFTAMATGDTDTLSSLCSELDDTEKIRIQKKAEYTENYDNFVCYTKPGPEDNSYIVFAYYEIKFKNIDTMAPGLTSLYVKTAEDGTLYVYDGELDDNVSAYIKAIAAQDDVVDLLNKVDTKYSDASDADSTLKSFMEALPTALDDAVTAALAEQENQSASDAGSVSDSSSAESKKMKAKETINVRKSPSEEGDKLGQLTGGDVLTCLETMGNGWSKIDYQGQEAYVKSEYLEDVDAQPEETTEDTTENTDTQKTETTTDTSKSIGKVTVKETVKIRKGANTDSEKIASAYQGESYDLLMEMEDGWCKIDYKGQTAYIKSEFVDIKKN